MNTLTHLVIEIDGKRYTLPSYAWETLDSAPTGHDNYQVHAEDQSLTIMVQDFNQQTRMGKLIVDGELKTFRILQELDLLIEKMGLNAGQAKRSNGLQAPMPGLVTSIRVLPGQEVDKGAPLMILEAMKMENVITAPHQAIIKEVLVIVGQAVEKGTLLVEFTEN